MGDTNIVEISTAAAAKLSKLPQSLQAKILDYIELLGEDPHPEGVEMLQQEPRLLRARVGEYRIVYTVDEESQVLIVLVLRHWGEAYRDLDKLDPSLVAKSLKPFLTGISASMS
jgi:mRNA interferase RelE/StbE